MTAAVDAPSFDTPSFDLGAVVTRIRERQAELGLTGRELARRAGLDAGACSRILAGKTAPSLDSLAALAPALDCDLAALLGIEAPAGAELRLAGGVLRFEEPWPRETDPGHPDEEAATRAALRRLADWTVDTAVETPIGSALAEALHALWHAVPVACGVVPQDAALLFADPADEEDEEAADEEEAETPPAAPPPPPNLDAEGLAVLREAVGSTPAVALRLLAAAMIQCSPPVEIRPDLDLPGHSRLARAMAGETELHNAMVPVLRDFWPEGGFPGGRTPANCFRAVALLGHDQVIRLLCRLIALRLGPGRPGDPEDLILLDLLEAELGLDLYRDHPPDSLAARYWLDGWEEPDREAALEAAMIEERAYG